MVFQAAFSVQRLTTPSAIAATTALAAVIVKLLHAHHRGVGIMFALRGNVIVIIGHACHQVGGVPRSFEPRSKFLFE